MDQLTKLEILKIATNIAISDPKSRAEDLGEYTLKIYDSLCKKLNESA